MIYYYMLRLIYNNTNNPNLNFPYKALTGYNIQFNPKTTPKTNLPTLNV
jgi:hypothetical protein